MTEPNDTRNIPDETSAKETTENSPLIFISHDSRDAGVAEAFSKLIKSVSAGMLKSFRSSDRQGNEGIQYGDEWYKRLMERLDKASDVVCLFTKQSLNRPWILFEAGVAKGKLETPVHGVAVGIPLEQVTTGPFYQFQNCQDDVDGLTGLVMQLLKKLPNAEPDRDAISAQVNIFKATVDEINSHSHTNNKEQNITTSVIEPNAGARLFEEIKVMVRDLPSNIEDRFLDGRGAFQKKGRRIHPMMFEELAHVATRKSPNPYLGLLIMTGFLRDDAPWLYELGVDAYRASQNDDKDRTKKALHHFQNVLEFTLHHPLMHEMFMESKENYIFLRELEHSLERIIMLCEQSANKDRTSPKTTPIRNQLNEK